EYLRSKNLFCEEFLEYLRNFKFSCDIWSVREGTPVFPNEPLLIVRGPIVQAQLIETMVLLTINHPSMIATKASRIVRAAKGHKVYEFGSRRAQGFDGAILGARAAYIGGCHGTACAIADRNYGIPAVGTMAHSWVQMFDTEYDAFSTYAGSYPDSCSLLVDTYNVIKSGVPNAIRVFDEVLKPQGKRPVSIRIDSGDIAYLSKKARKLLDDAGYPDCKIMASNSLDEYIIRDLLMQGAKLDIFGVGENLITSKSAPVFGGVYKLVALQNAQGEYVPKIKISETIEKITNPGFKMLYRLYDNATGKALADYITGHEEEVNDKEELVIFDPNATWKKQRLVDFTAVPLLEKVIENGNVLIERRDLEEIRNYCAEQLETLWDEVKRFENPHKYYVDLSPQMYEMKVGLLEKLNF
ncbi:MAG: nicotinate phosphoribosyltransferase, partial [Oscillospiraceae bacterium]|nr:nicotinate phosphoribosyltransferase [Oscillospiraceae bacterium]